MSKVELLVGLERQLAWLLERHSSFSCAFGVVVEKKSITPYINSVLSIATWAVAGGSEIKKFVCFVIVLKYYDIILPPVQ